MPTAIVAEMCPAPECNLTTHDVRRFVKYSVLVRAWPHLSQNLAEGRLTLPHA